MNEHWAVFIGRPPDRLPMFQLVFRNQFDKLQKELVYCLDTNVFVNRSINLKVYNVLHMIITFNRNSIWNTRAHATGQFRWRSRLVNKGNNKTILQRESQNSSVGEQTHNLITFPPVEYLKIQGR